MPQCPTCKTHYEVGQRYCEQCDSYLLNPEEGDYFCPECGIRVASQQELCHKCSTSLLGITAAPTPVLGTPSPAAPKVPPSQVQEVPPYAPGPGLPPWALGALIGAGVLIVILFLILLFRKGPAPKKVAQALPPKAVTTAAPTKPPAPAAKEPAAPVAPKPVTPPAAPPAATPAPEAALADQVRETLGNLRDAQLWNDIVLFMSCYSSLYPSLDKKRQQTLAYWKDFNYLDLNFILNDVKPLGPDSALARVTWTMQVENRKSQQVDSFTQVFEVGLAKELGNWRIRSIKDLTYEQEEEE